MQVLKSSSWDSLLPLLLQKISEDNFNELEDYSTPFCEDNTRTGIVVQIQIIWSL